jgi:hypothetical protein
VVFSSCILNVSFIVWTPVFRFWDKLDHSKDEILIKTLFKSTEQNSFFKNNFVSTTELAKEVNVLYIVLFNSWHTRCGDYIILKLNLTIIENLLWIS